MTQEKKPRRTAAKKNSTKKFAGKTVLKTAPVPTMAAAPVQVKNCAKVKTKSFQISIEEVIRLRAYEIYLQRGGTPGNPHEDWNVAERQVRAHFGGEGKA